MDFKYLFLFALVFVAVLELALAAATKGKDSEESDDMTNEFLNHLDSLVKPDTKLKIKPKGEYENEIEVGGALPKVSMKKQKKPKKNDTSTPEIKERNYAYSEESDDSDYWKALTDMQDQDEFKKMGFKCAPGKTTIKIRESANPRNLERNEESEERTLVHEESETDREENGTDSEEIGTDREENGTDSEKIGTDSEENGSDSELALRSHMHLPLNDDESCQICVCSVDGKKEYCSKRPAKNTNECLLIGKIMEARSRHDPYYHIKSLPQMMRTGNAGKLGSNLGHGTVCIPHMSQYSDCTEERLCSGCHRCDCNELGQWDCELVQNCSPKEMSEVRDSTLDNAMQELDREFGSQKSVIKKMKHIKNALKNSDALGFIVGIV